MGGADTGACATRQQPPTEGRAINGLRTAVLGAFIQLPVGLIRLVLIKRTYSYKRDIEFGVSQIQDPAQSQWCAQRVVRHRRLQP